MPGTFFSIGKCLRCQDNGHITAYVDLTHLCQAGIAKDLAYGEMKPEQKAAFIEDLRHQGRKVSMVGDGINDAPALAAAHVGMALRGGLDVAGEAASVILMGDRLGQVMPTVSATCCTLLAFWQQTDS